MQKKVVDIAAWSQKRKTRPLELPSGAVVEVVENTLLPLIANSLLPMALLAKVQKMEAPKDTVSPEQEQIIEGYNKLLKLITEVVVAPQLSVSELACIPGEDLQFLIAYIMRGKEAERIAGFRGEAGGPAAGCPVQEVQSAAV